ncbi:importin-5-like [Durio zibethinus]|uniref:Importin-5-like n=1 Tax=Durio zibethinus TaxID=66656 RepID=A0A6P5Z312_DURZI|nr:importin-5-like [Durio zibethinus]
MSTDSISTQRRLEELDNILDSALKQFDPDLEPFEILICQLDSYREDQVSRAESLFSLARNCRLDSLSLALSRLLSSPLPDLRAQAALLLGEHFTTAFFERLKRTTLDTLKSALLSAFRNKLFKLDVDNLFQTISDFHATGSWPELLPFLFECVNSQSPNLQEYALLVFKRLAQNLDSHADLIFHLNTFQQIFRECLDNCSSWDVKIAALDASISFVQFIPNQNDPNRFDYLLRLMMRTLTNALNSGSESKSEESLQLLIKLAKTDPRFFERQLEKVLQLMLNITVDDSLEVDIKHSAIEFLMALVESDPRMISKEPQFIKRLFDELMYMLFDVEYVDEDEYEVDNFWGTSDYILAKKCLSKLSILLDEKMIFQRVLRLFSHLLGTSIWQQRHATLIAIPKIALGSNKMMPKNMEEVVPMILESVNDPHPWVQLAAINAIKQLSVCLCPMFQNLYHEIVLVTLVEVMNEDLRPKLQVSATSAVLSFMRYGDEKIQVFYKRTIWHEFSKFIRAGHIIGHPELRILSCGLVDEFFKCLEDKFLQCSEDKFLQCSEDLAKLRNSISNNQIENYINDLKSLLRWFDVKCNKSKNKLE